MVNEMKNRTQKSIISMILVLALVVGCFAAMPPTSAENTDTFWTLYDENAGVEITLETTLQGSNLILQVTVYVDGVKTLTDTLYDFGTGNTNPPIKIGGYTIFAGIQGNKIGHGGTPAITDGLGLGCEFVEIENVPATCTKDGYILWQCKNHGETYIEDLEALGHDFSVLIDHKEATYEEAGYEIFKCIRCDETTTVIIPKLEHPTVTSTEVTSYSKNLQDANNDKFLFTVCITLSDKTTVEIHHAEKVNAQQTGNTTFNYESYSVYVSWDDNNTVVVCKIV